MYDVKIWQINEDCKQFVANLVVKGYLCPCDGFQSVKANAMLNKLGKWDDIPPVLIHHSHLTELSEKDLKKLLDTYESDI